jgi:hypothetical protein
MRVTTSARVALSKSTWSGEFDGDSAATERKKLCEILLYTDMSEIMIMLATIAARLKLEGYGAVTTVQTAGN